MAIYRKVQTTFWTDPFVETLDNDQRLFYLFLMTNPLSNQIGIYEISIGFMARTLKCKEDTVKIMLNFFAEKGKIQYSESTQELALKNWAKHNFSESPKVQACMRSEVAKLKNKDLFNWLYEVGRHSKNDYDIFVPRKHDFTGEAPPIIPITPPAPKQPKAKAEAFVPPTKEEVEQFFVEHGYAKDLGTRAFKYYDLGNWKNKEQKPVLNWKQTMISVWMKNNPKSDTPEPQRAQSSSATPHLSADERARISKEKADQQINNG